MALLAFADNLCKQFGPRSVGPELDPNHLTLIGFLKEFLKLEDLKVLRRSPDLFNNVKIGQSFTAYNKSYFVSPYMGIAAILVK